ncbi:MAG: hypothetical protein JSU05_15945, partial [Bacteroidetes bacterium]|nr:hypothetical protein [Bacteroidota bacterium]
KENFVNEQLFVDNSTHYLRKAGDGIHFLISKQFDVFHLIDDGIAICNVTDKIVQPQNNSYSYAEFQQKRDNHS